MKTKNKYIPQPVNTSDVVLPEELINLSEQISKNVHEVWSKNRLEQGWTYGEQRNDEKRETPCLVPYDELSEEEKYFDRCTSQETLKLIIKLGFKIIKK